MKEGVDNLISTFEPSPPTAEQTYSPDPGEEEMQGKNAQVLMEQHEPKDNTTMPPNLLSFYQRTPKIKSFAARQWTRGELFSGLETVGNWEITLKSSSSNPDSMAVHQGNEKSANSGEVPVVKRLEESPYFESVQKDIMTIGDLGHRKVYTRGLCANNGSEDAQAVVGVWWGERSAYNVGKKIERKAGERHNTWFADIHSAIEALEVAHQQQIKQLRVHTPSLNLVKTMDTWIWKWKHQNWKTNKNILVKHRESLKKLDRLSRQDISVQWMYTKRGRGTIEAEMLAANAREPM